MIPKKIHYCWFGGNPLPKLAKKCIKSWKRYCPDYEIIRWDESNFDIASAPLYVQQAYNAKKWAFVTDYVRLCAMVTQGGIYMDTDVEVVKSLDSFLQHEAFSGFEVDTHISTGVMACEKGFSLFKEFLDYYNDAVFIRDDGTYNQTTNVIIMTDIAKKYGLKQDGTYQIINGMALYPEEYFCPLDFNLCLHNTENTHTIHWFAASWESEEYQASLGRKRKLRQKAERRDKIRYFSKRLFRKFIGDEKVEALKIKLKRK